MRINALVTNYKDSPMRLNLVKILGVNKPITTVTINGKTYSNFLYNTFDQVCIYPILNGNLRIVFSVYQIDSTYLWT